MASPCVSMRKAPMTRPATTPIGSKVSLASSLSSMPNHRMETCYASDPTPGRK